MKKWIAIIVASIAVILVCIGVIFTRQRKQSVALNKETTAMRAKNTSDLVTDVGDDLTNGDLKATKSSNTNYQLGNKFGSVNVVVEDNDVKVTGDGDFTASKADLKEKCGAYVSQI